jgi:hypothetical protein
MPSRALPAQNEQLVRERARTALERAQPCAIVCAAACGADLIALDEAGKLGVRRRVVLPNPKARFRANSVVDRPGAWIGEHGFHRSTSTQSTARHRSTCDRERRVARRSADFRPNLTCQSLDISLLPWPYFDLSRSICTLGAAAGLSLFSGLPTIFAPSTDQTKRFRAALDLLIRVESASKGSQRQTPGLQRVQQLPAGLASSQTQTAR